jgi:hypothetical protein
MNRTLIAAAVALTLPGPSLAQEPGARHGHRFVLNGHDLMAQAAEARVTADAMRLWGDDLRASMGAMFGDHFSSAKAVKGAPYSADVSTEAKQSLADGNVISTKTTGRVYRDGEGRTRQETVVNGEAKSIQLRDPVEGTAVMLLPGTRKAVRMPSFAWHSDGKELKVLRLGDREIRVEDGKVSLDGREVPGRIELKVAGKEIVVDNGKVTIDGKEVGRGEGGKKVVVRRIDETETGDGTKREEVRVHVVRGPDGKESRMAMPGMPPPGSPLLPRFDAALLKSKGATTSLGEKDIEGVRAQGKAVSHTIPAGDIGNRNPIVVTSESWYSPELQVTVYSRQSDPRYGETVYRLANIRRGEPAPELFKVPEEYAGSRRGRG